jgi:16S rRNA (guanine(1405)-N(7))-methyltransferase
MEETINHILEKKELRGIDTAVVIKFIKKNLDAKSKRIIEEKRFKSKEYKAFVKKVRADLRRSFGAFNNPKIDRNKLIEKNEFIKIIKSHLSSKERLPYYKEIYNKIFGNIKKPVSIIDLGCGMNPLSSEFMNVLPKNYLALDINADDLNIIKKYFEKKKINGKIRVFDASKLSNYIFNETYDFCFAFKLFEILETSKSHKLTEDIILRIPSKAIVASFSTRTLSGAPMSRKRRIWFEVMAKRLGYKSELFEAKNEIFYILKKQ